MITNKKSIRKINSTLEKLDEKDFEVERRILQRALVDECATEFEVARKVMRANPPGAMPKVLVSLVKKLLEVAGDEGDGKALNELGTLYYLGDRGFPQDYEKATDFYRRACEAGDEDACENYGYCLYYGRAGEPDYENAFRRFSEGAFVGRGVSTYKIGDMYVGGLYVDKDEEKAVRIWKRCLENMREEEVDDVAGPVNLRLGRAYLFGNGIERNAFTALLHLHEAEKRLFIMVADGNFFYVESLKEAISLQNEARKLLAEETGIELDS